MAALRNNYTLFGRLTSQECAEALHYGPVPLNPVDDDDDDDDDDGPGDDHDYGGRRAESHSRLPAECAAVFEEAPGFLSTFDGDQLHDAWWQLVLRKANRADLEATAMAVEAAGFRSRKRARVLGALPT